MEKLLIFTGVDGSGKTTFVDRLVNKYNCEAIHFCAPKDFNHAKSDYLSFLEKQNTSCVVDRLHDGEFVYGIKYRNNNIEEVIEFTKEYETKLKDKFDVKLFYVFADKDTLLKRYETRGEDFIDWLHIEELQELYNIFLKTTSLETYIIDTTHETIENNLDKIIDIVEATNENI